MADGEAGKEAADPPKRPSPAQLAEARIRERLTVVTPPVDNKTGRLACKAKPAAMWVGMKHTGDCRSGCIGSVETAIPVTNPKATLQQYYESHPNFGVFNLMVSRQALQRHSK